MRRAVTIIFAAAILAGTCGVAQAQGNGRPCFREAEEFGRTLTAMGGLAKDVKNPSPQVKQATDLRNLGMEACLAGKVSQGRALIEQATAMLTQG